MASLPNSPRFEDAFEIANPQLITKRAIQKYFHVSRVKGRVDQRVKLRVCLLVSNRDAACSNILPCLDSNPDV